MPEISSSYPSERVVKTSQFPIASIVRALCQAANSGPDLLYEVMLKLSLLVEAAAPMYGLSIWSLDSGQRPRLNWAEGLQEPELVVGEQSVARVRMPIGTGEQRPAWNAVRGLSGGARTGSGETCEREE